MEANSQSLEEKDFIVTSNFNMVVKRGDKSEPEKCKNEKIDM